MNQSVGIKLPGLIPHYASSLSELVDLVVEFERMGFDDIVDSAHLLFAPEMQHPAGAGSMVHGRDHQHSDRSEPLILFGAIAARTTRLKMMTGVLLAAGHSFAVLAQQAATLDRLSEGRFALGVGTGWFPGEFEAIGIAAQQRGERLEETIRACQELWRPGLSSFKGTWISFQDVISEPAPYTDTGVPVWWGGNADAGPTARRVVELGQGWIAREAAGYDEVARGIERLIDTCDRYGRDPHELGFRASLTPTPAPGFTELPDQAIGRAVASATRLAAVGVTHFTVPLNHYRLSLGELGRLLTALRGELTQAGPGPTGSS